ncbi:MAG: hypothetical protein F6K28_40080 [Microcoleus sp. SIO2G3]|nr:hypothetical protein [Microcoleus sp. SIO2G3]
MSADFSHSHRLTIQIIQAVKMQLPYQPTEKEHPSRYSERRSPHLYNS